MDVKLQGYNSMCAIVSIVDSQVMKRHDKS